MVGLDYCFIMNVLKAELFDKLINIPCSYSRQNIPGQETAKLGIVYRRKKKSHIRRRFKKIKSTKNVQAFEELKKHSIIFFSWRNIKQNPKDIDSVEKGLIHRRWLFLPGWRLLSKESV